MYEPYHQNFKMTINICVRAVQCGMCAYMMFNFYANVWRMMMVLVLNTGYGILQCTIISCYSCFEPLSTVVFHHRGCCFPAAVALSDAPHSSLALSHCVSVS